MQVLSKGDFAAHIGVSAGRVSQYIAAGMIGPDALDGQGRNAKVIVARAVEQIKRQRNIGQALGNGLMTRLDADEPEIELPAPGGTSRETPKSTVDDELKQERLQAERRRNRLAAEDEAQRRGQLVDARQSAAELAKALIAQKAIVERAAHAAASKCAAQFGVPERDMKHAFRKHLAEELRVEADRIRRAAAGLPEIVETIIEENAA